MPETVGDGAAGPILGQRAAKSVVVMSAVSGSSYRHPETDRCSTVLEVLIEQLRRLVVTGFLFQLLDVLSHAYADVCLPTQTRSHSISAPPLIRTGGILNRHPSPSAVVFASLHAAHHATTSTRIPVLSP